MRPLVLAMCSALLGSCTVSPPARAGDSDPAAVAFVGVSVVPMTLGDRVLANHTVVVREGRIAAIGPAPDVRVPRGALRIEAAGGYLMPGLADMHVHLEHFEDPDLLTLFLASGVTTVRNMDGRPHVLEWRRGIAAGELLGPTIYTAGPVLDGHPPVLDDNTVVRTPEEARTAVREQAAAGYDFIKVYTNLSPGAYRAVLETAHGAGLPVGGHVPRAVGTEEALQAGQRSIEHLADYGGLVEAENSPVRGRFHWSKLYLAMPIDPARVERAARRVAGSDVWTVPTLVQADRALPPPDSVEAWLGAPEMSLLPVEARTSWEEHATRTARRLDDEDWEIVGRGRRNRLLMLRALHQAGANLLVGTDTPNPFVIPGYSLHEELENFIAAGLPIEAALAAATREAARFLEDLDEWGTVEVGKRADLLLLEGDPFESLENLRQPAGVMVRGFWLPAERLREVRRCSWPGCGRPGT